jgi:hypothetical protein
MIDNGANAMLLDFGCNFLAECTYDFAEVCGFKKTPFRSKFIPSKIWSEMDSLRGDITAFTKYFKKFKTDVLVNIPNQTYKSVPVSGFYTPDTNRIELILTTTNFDYFLFNQTSWNEFKFIVIQVLCHEIIHMMQFVNRDFAWSYRKCKFRTVKSEAVNQDRLYHSSLDEIQAYAHCIYLELTEIGIPIPKDKKQVQPFKMSPTFNMVLRVFGNRMAEPTLQKVMYHVKQWDKKYTQHETRRHNKNTRKDSGRCITDKRG